MKRVLIIEDDVTTVNMLRAGLEAKLPVKVESRTSGLLGLDAIRDSFFDLSPYDIVILDLEVPLVPGKNPYMDERFGIRAIRAAKHSTHFPFPVKTRVFINSGKLDKNKIVDCVKCGADRVFLKGEDDIVQACDDALYGRLDLQASWCFRNRAELIKKFGDGVMIIVLDKAFSEYLDTSPLDPYVCDTHPADCDGKREFMAFDAVRLQELEELLQRYNLYLVFRPFYYRLQLDAD